MNYISNIKINYFVTNKVNNKYYFNFLDILDKYIDTKKIYNYLNGLTIRQINNIYKIIYIKWINIIKDKSNIYKINKKIDINEFNNNIKKFINLEIDNVSKYSRAIFVINIIYNN